VPKKKYLVVARNERTSQYGLETSKGNLPFHSKTARIVEDPNLASEIDTEYGLKGSGDVWVERDEMLENNSAYHPDGVHRYFFGPTRKFVEGWERIFGNGKEVDSGSDKTPGSSAQDPRSQEGQTNPEVKTASRG
jgi:hypothetical protein